MNRDHSAIFESAPMDWISDSFIEYDGYSIFSKGFLPTVSQFSHSVVSDSANPWTAACQASLSVTNSWSPFRLTFIESVMPSKHLILCRPLSSCLHSFPASWPLQISQFFASGGQSVGVSASTSVFPMNIQVWFPLGWTGLISMKSKGLSRVFSNTTVQKHQFFSTQLSLYSNSHIHTWLLEKP